MDRLTLPCILPSVNQKQAELDDLHLKLHYTQKYIDILHGDVKAKKNINQETRAQKKKAEQEKLQQVTSRPRLDSQMTLELISLINHRALSSGSVCGASDEGAGESDGADQDV